MIIMKFGGAALSSADNILKTCKIVKKYQKKDNIVIVVSAMKGVTNKLHEAVIFIKNNQAEKALDIVKSIKDNYLQTLKKVNPHRNRLKAESRLLHLTTRLENFMNYNKNKKVNLAKIDFIISFGERLSCFLFADALETHKISACSIDTSCIIATNSRFGNASPLPNNQQKHIDEILLSLSRNNIIPVVSGFIGFAPDGRITTMGRGGSDLSAAYLANHLNAKGLYLWKDVDGFYSNNPHKDSQAILLERLSYRQATEKARAGAKIIYHKAIKYAQEKKIPIYLKSFFNPNAIGTIIKDEVTLC